MFLFRKCSCSEEEPASKKCMFWIITCSGEKAPPKQYQSEKVLKVINFQEVANQEKYWLPGSSY